MLDEVAIGRIVYEAIDLVNARSVHEFRVPPDTYIGPGALTRIGPALSARQRQRVFVMIDEHLENLDLADGMYRSFAAAGLAWEIYRQCQGEPDSTAVDEALGHLKRAACDSIVAFGGGSAIDAAKVTAILAANPELSLADLAEGAQPRNPRLPFVAVPTTAGTGSEATDVAVITDSKAGVKRVIANSGLIPDLAIIDACLTLGVPPAITAATGIDALTHAVEAYLSPRATPLTNALAYRAITLIGESLPVAVGQGGDVNAREAMALASYMAGMAFSNAGLGLCHAMSHQLGAHYHIPHGTANAVLLPSVMQFNLLVCRKRYPEIGLALCGHPMAAQEVIDTIGQLIVDIGLPGNLKMAGADARDFPGLADYALADSCLMTNPRTADRQQIIDVFAHALDR